MNNQSQPSSLSHGKRRTRGLTVTVTVTVLWQASHLVMASVGHESHGHGHGLFILATYHKGLFKPLSKHIHIHTYIHIQ